MTKNILRQEKQIWMPVYFEWVDIFPYLGLVLLV